MDGPVRIKTFRSKTLQDAIEQIRKEFGPTASVLETKTSKRGLFGSQRVEVTASSNHSASRLDSPAKIDVTNEEADQGLVEDSTGVPHVEDNDGSNQDSPPNFTSDTLVPRSSGEGLSNSTTKIDRICNQVRQDMLRSGLDTGIIDQWLMAARLGNNPQVFQDAWSLQAEIQLWVRDFVHCAPPLDLDANRCQRLAFVGPTGAGKTTTIAKLAAMLSMERQLRVGILQLDTKNHGPCRLLTRYVELMGWDYRRAVEPGEIQTSLSELDGCRFVLVDTPGCSPSDGDSLRKLEDNLSKLQATSTLLVAPSTCSVHTYLRYETCFGGLNPDSLILTKLDESGGLGPLFSCLQSSSIPVSFLTTGQHVPADLIPATNARLAQHVLGFSM